MTDPIPISDLLPELLATIEAAHEAASSMSGTEHPFLGSRKTQGSAANASQALGPVRGPARPSERRFSAAPESAVSVRCGRRLGRLEGRIDERTYCHPDDPRLPDCYTIASHEQTLGAPLPAPAAELINRASVFTAKQARDPGQNGLRSTPQPAPVQGSNAARDQPRKDAQ